MNNNIVMSPQKAVDTLFGEIGRAVCTLLKNAKAGADEETAALLKAHLDNINHFANQAPAELKHRLEPASRITD